MQSIAFPSPSIAFPSPWALRTRALARFLATDQGPALRAIALAFAPLVALPWALLATGRSLLAGQRQARSLAATIASLRSPSVPAGAVVIQPLDPIVDIKHKDGALAMALRPSVAIDDSFADQLLTSFAGVVAAFDHDGRFLDDLQALAGDVEEMPHSVIEIVQPVWAATLAQQPEHRFGSLEAATACLEDIRADLDTTKSLLAL